MSSTTDNFDHQKNLYSWFFAFIIPISYGFQLYTNFRKKSVKQMSLEFVGFTLGYSIYLVLYLLTSYTKDYRGGHPEPADIVYAFISFTMAALFIPQIIFYKKKKNQRIPYFSITVFLLCLISTFINLGLWNNNNIDHNFWNHPISQLGYWVCLFSFLQFIPQIHRIRKKGKMKGFSLFVGLFQIIGGLFMIAAMVMYMLKVNWHQKNRSTKYIDSLWMVKGWIGMWALVYGIFILSLACPKCCKCCYQKKYRKGDDDTSKEDTSIPLTSA